VEPRGGFSAKSRAFDASNLCRVMTKDTRGYILLLIYHAVDSPCVRGRVIA